MFQAQTSTIRTCIRRSTAQRLYASTAQASSESQQFSYRSVIIRPSGLSSIADVYAIIRGIEAKYGKIQEFKAMRDTQISTAFQPRIFAVFESKFSARKIPETGAKLTVESITQEDRPGGLSLQDFEHLLVPIEKPVEDPSVDKDASQSTSSWESVLEKSNVSTQSTEDAEPKRKLVVSIERSEREWHSRSKPTAVYHMSPTMQENFGRKFLAFNGFSPLEPITVEKKRALAEGKDDTYWMRRVTEKWASQTGLLDPGMEAPSPPASTQVSNEELSENAKLIPVLSDDIIQPPPLAEESKAKSTLPQSPPTPTIPLTATLRSKVSTDTTKNDQASKPADIVRQRPKAPKIQHPSQDSTASQSSDSKRVEKRTGQARRAAAQEKKDEEDARLSDRLKKMIGGWF